MSFDLFFYNFILFNLSALAITDTELKLIARAAIIGESNKPKNGYRMPAAIGIPSILYPSAKNRFSLMFLITLWLNRRAFAMPFRSPFTKVIDCLLYTSPSPRDG